MKALKADTTACSLLGEPLRFQTLRLGDKENLVTSENAQVEITRGLFFNNDTSFLMQVLIPVTGSKASGHLRSKATFTAQRWQLDSVVLEFKGRTDKLTIFDGSKN